MTTILVLMLVCSATIAHDDCTRDTANSVMTHPAKSVMECGQIWETEPASLTVLPAADEYLMVRCERSAPTSEAPR